MHIDEKDAEEIQSVTFKNETCPDCARDDVAKVLHTDNHTVQCVRSSCPYAERGEHQFRYCRRCSWQTAAALEEAQP